MRNIALILAYLISSAISAQDSTDRVGYDSENFVEKLVLLAWENDPESEVVRRNVNVAKYDVKLSGLEWLNLVSATGNLNEFNLDPQSDFNNRSQFFPRYNVSASISLGMLFTIPYSTRRSREELMIAESQVEKQRNILEAEVKRLYNSLMMEEKIFKLQAEMALDAENKLGLSEEKFRAGEITFEGYSEMRNSYSQSKISLYQAEASFKNAKITLEEIIGVKLEEVEK